MLFSDLRLQSCSKRMEISYIYLTILFIICSLSNANIYLYDTEDGISLEYYDCMSHKGLSYCRRPSKPINLNRTNSSRTCYQYHEQLKFSVLLKKNVSVSEILHEWKSTIQTVEEYVIYLQQTPEWQAENDGYICNCTSRGVFGRYCEYVFRSNYTISSAIEDQFNTRISDTEGKYITNDMICYTTLDCDSGLVCLDWREICDGVQQCMFGYDEDNCDLLEYNECESNEYRCMNGMCIPDVYFLDGQYDCMDLSDEIGFFNDTLCPLREISPECDDRFCNPNEWSCGDGQCVVHRLGFQAHLLLSASCANRRDQFFMCETHSSEQEWTLPAGICTSDTSFVQEKPINQTAFDECLYFLRCAFSDGAEAKCPCKYDRECYYLIKNPCKMNIVPFPYGRILSPYLQLFIYQPRSWFEYTPDLMLIEGTIKCRGYLVYQKFNLTYSHDWNYRTLESIICQYRSNNTIIMSGGYDIDCFKEYKSYRNISSRRVYICPISRECISAYRLNDGYYNCVDKSDENITDISWDQCSNSKHHRFRCSAAKPTCLYANYLADLMSDCENKFDESWMGSGIALSKMNCNPKSNEDCSTIRRYIEASWNIDYNTIKNDGIIKRIPFRAYCDTFWDLISKEDENTKLCNTYWRCIPQQWQCRTGQCINLEWLLDGEWDCTDGSDEEALFFKTDTLTQFKEKGIDYTKMRKKYDDVYDGLPFYNLCNIEEEFACYRAGAGDPWKDLMKNRPCINYEKLGDGVVDCLGGLDERNTLEFCNQPIMLGPYFKCASSDECIPYAHVCDRRCSNQSDDEIICSEDRKTQSCSKPGLDFVCFDGSCAHSSWCNETSECTYGEDEYLCENSDNQFYKPVHIFYRRRKELSIRYDQQTFELTNKNDTHKKLAAARQDFDPLIVYYGCNRGLVVSINETSAVCFCPQFYYGDQCEFHQDRLSFRFHLNYSLSSFARCNDTDLVLKLLIVFQYEDRILGSSVSYVRPALEIEKYEKKTVVFAHPRHEQLIELKRQRFRNRSDLFLRQPYKIRVEAYQLKPFERPNLTAVWEYPIDFDHLPSFRLVKVLHFIELDPNTNPCSSNPCNKNQECQPILNKKQSHTCICLPNFEGENCSIFNELCSKNFCSALSLCRPGYRGLSNHKEKPYCVCPSNYFGPRCILKHDRCDANPCKNGGSCFPTTNPARYFCNCPPMFHGSRCEIERAWTQIKIDEAVKHEAAVIQYLSIFLHSLDLLLVHQEVSNVVPKFLFFERGDLFAPEIVLMKIYDERQILFYLISVQLRTISVDRTTNLTEENRCLPVESIVPSQHNLSPILYHSICWKNTSLLCFYDDIYLCICNRNHTRVDCFGYDHEFDRCSHCLASGICVKGDVRRRDDFLCLCPKCHGGRLCQFNTEHMSLTLDSLFVHDSLSIQLSYVFLVTIINIVGGILNYASFLTFFRPEPRRIGVGNYLLIFSILSQCSLFMLFLKMFHMVVGNSRSDVLCKLISYLLSTSTRFTNWLTSLISIERVFCVLFPFAKKLKEPRLALTVSIISAFLIAVAHFHELVYYISLRDPHGETFCVLNTRFFLVSKYNRLTVLIHYVGPFCVQIISITSLIILMAKSRATLSKQHHAFRQQLKLQFDTQRELYIAPLIIIICSLPHIMLSFVLACITLETWQRHIMIVAYFLSHAPQSLGFLLFVIPSSTYSQQFFKTNLSKKYLFRRLMHH